MGAALSIFDKNKFYLKNTNVVEQLGVIDTIVFDKTETVTHFERNNVCFEGTLNQKEKEIIYSVCKNSIPTLSRKICDFLSPIKPLKVQDYLEHIGSGITASCENKKVLIGNANLVLCGITLKTNAPQVLISINDVYLGYFEIRQKIRSGLQEILTQLNLTYRTFLISGDKHQNAAALNDCFKNKSDLYFDQSPQNKLDFITHQQQQNNKVLMLGDGLNDAGALMQSNVGIAVTDNINNFTPDSDAILDGQSLTLLPLFFKLRKIYG